jgi:hypothetical protein
MEAQNESIKKSNYISQYFASTISHYRAKHSKKQNTINEHMQIEIKLSHPVTSPDLLPSLLVFLAFCSISINFSALFPVIPLYFCS